MTQFGELITATGADTLDPGAKRRRAASCVLGMSSSLGVKVRVSVLCNLMEVKHERSARAEPRGTVEAWSEIATRRTETGYEAALVGRAGRKSQSPYPSRTRT